MVYPALATRSDFPGSTNSPGGGDPTSMVGLGHPQNHTRFVGIVFGRYSPGAPIDDQRQTPRAECGLVCQDSSYLLGCLGCRSSKLVASGFSSVYCGGQHSKNFTFSAKSPH